MTQPNQSDASINPPRHRPLSATLRRNAFPLLVLLCLLSSAIFLYSPLLHRSYNVQGDLKVSARAFEPIPELQRLPEAALQELAPIAADTDVHLATETDNNAKSIRLSATGPNRDLAQARLARVAEQLAAFMHHRADELISSYRSSLTKQSDSLTERETALGKQIQNFRLTHRGVLPDDPTSVIAQFEKLNTRLDDKQQRQRIVTDQIRRLEEYKAKSATAAGRNLAPPPPIAPAPQELPDVAAGPANDPEIATLGAQLQLVNDQIDDQLTNKHRTEEHPYVKDLRSQQTDLQKKLDAAKQRAAAGQPSPVAFHAPQTPRAATADATLAAAQEVDLQLQSLQAEHDALDLDIHNITAQRDVMQHDVDQVMPIRQEYEKLTSQLAAAQKDHQALNAQIETVGRQFGPSAESTNSSATPAITSNSPVEIAPLAMTSNSTLPTFPNLPLIYAVGLFAGLAAASLLALTLHRTDRSLHSSREAAAILSVPILGTVSEIRTRAQQRTHRLWQSALRPLLSLALVLLTIGSAFLCYHRLADPTFSQNVQQQGVAFSSFGVNRP